MLVRPPCQCAPAEFRTACAGDLRTLRKGSRGKAITLFSQMVGTLLISRAVADIDPALADEILDEGRQQLLTTVDA